MLLNIVFAGIIFSKIVIQNRDQGEKNYVGKHTSHGLEFVEHIRK